MTATKCLKLSLKMIQHHVLLELFIFSVLLRLMQSGQFFLAFSNKPSLKVEYIEQCSKRCDSLILVVAMKALCLVLGDKLILWFRVPQGQPDVLPRQTFPNMIICSRFILKMSIEYQLISDRTKGSLLSIWMKACISLQT